MAADTADDVIDMLVTRIGQLPVGSDARRELLDIVVALAPDRTGPPEPGTGAMYPVRRAGSDGWNVYIRTITGWYLNGDPRSPSTTWRELRRMEPNATVHATDWSRRAKPLPWTSPDGRLTLTRDLTDPDVLVLTVADDGPVRLADLQHELIPVAAITSAMLLTPQSREPLLIDERPGRPRT